MFMTSTAPLDSPQAVATQLGSGLLSFPVTHLTADGAFDEAAYRDNIGWLGQFDAAGLFAAGGTGEFFSLTPAEVNQVVAAAVAEGPSLLHGIHHLERGYHHPFETLESLGLRLERVPGAAHQS